MAYPRRQLCKALTGYRGNNPRCTRTMPDRWAPHRSRRSSSPRAMGNTIAIAEVTCPIAGHPPPSTSQFDSSMSRYRHLTVQPHPRVVQLSRFPHGATPPSGGSIKSVRLQHASIPSPHGATPPSGGSIKSVRLQHASIPPPHGATPPSVGSIRSARLQHESMPPPHGATPPSGGSIKSVRLQHASIPPPHGATPPSGGSIKSV